MAKTIFLAAVSIFSLYSLLRRLIPKTVMASVKISLGAQETFGMTDTEDRKALDELFSLCYEELRRLASAILRSEGVARLTPTTLVNEAWLKLAPYPSAANTSVLHFRRIAGRAMRQVLVDIARRRLSQVHGGEFLHVTFDEALGFGGQNGDAREILALDAALNELGRMSPRQLSLVEARFFGGMSNTECAELLQCSEATLLRDWRAARAWLGREVRRSLLKESGGWPPSADTNHGAG